MGRSARQANSRRRPSVRRDFQETDNPVHNSVLQKPEGPDASYDRDDIFVGWKKGTKKHFESFRDAKWKEFGEMSADVYREALFMFQKKFADKDKNDTDDLTPLFLDQGSASVSFHAGERGAGKSFNLRGYGNRSAKAGILTIHIDPAHEYYTNNKGPAQKEKVIKPSAGLREGEDRQEINTVVLMPKFIQKARRQSNLGMPGRTWTIPFQFSFQDLDATDVAYMFLKDVNRKSDNKQFKDFQKFVGRLSDKIQKGHVEDFDDALKIAKRMQENGKFSYEERYRQIEDVIEPYKRWNFIGNDNNLEDSERFDSWEELLTEVNCISLSLEDDDNCPGHLEMMQFYIAILIKKVRSLRKQKAFTKPTNWVIDEIHRFVDSEDYDDREEAPLAHWEIRKIIKEDRKIGFRVAMASQQVQDIPEDNFLKQTDHMFIPMNMDSDDRRYLLQLYDIYSQGDDSRNKWKMIFDSMNEYEWFYMRKKTKEWCLLIPPAPLANHLSE